MSRCEPGRRVLRLFINCGNMVAELQVENATGSSPRMMRRMVVRRNPNSRAVMPNMKTANIAIATQATATSLTGGSSGPNPNGLSHRDPDHRSSVFASARVPLRGTTGAPSATRSSPQPPSQFLVIAGFADGSARVARTRNTPRFGLHAVDRAPGAEVTMPPVSIPPPARPSIVDTEKRTTGPGEDSVVHWHIRHEQATIGGRSLHVQAYVPNQRPTVMNCHVRIP